MDLITKSACGDIVIKPEDGVVDTDNAGHVCAIQCKRRIEVLEKEVADLKKVIKDRRA